MLESRAVPTGVPIHAIVDMGNVRSGGSYFANGRVEDAALRADGAIELIGSTSVDYLRPWSWTVSKDGALLDQRVFETPPDRTNGGMNLISPDGSKMLGFLEEGI